LTVGPRAVVDASAGRSGASAIRNGAEVGLVEGAQANLVVFDRSETMQVSAGTLRSKGKNSPLIGMSLPGRVLLTMAGGRVAYDGVDG
jgi:dihydroorotase